MESKVTALIAHKDYQDYLPDAINSCIQQTYSCHICIVDDGSKDQAKVISILGEIFPNEKPTEEINENWVILSCSKYTLVLLKENYGPSMARNIGISITQDFTDYYVILDADDMMLPYKVEILKYVLDTDPNIGVVYGDLTSINTETGQTKREFREPFSTFRLMHECIVHSGAMVRKQAMINCLENDSVYDPEMRTCEDYDLWIRISEKYMIMHVAENLTLIRIQPQNSTVTVDKSIWEQNWHRIREKLQKRETAGL